ncbi:MAG: polysaccharide deacetylase family protein [Candidatus Dormibacteria bacterium]
MHHNAPAEARRRDALNLFSFLTVVSMCLALAIFAGLRLTHTRPAAVASRLEGRVVLPASAAGGARTPLGPPSEAAQELVRPAPVELPGVVSHGDRGRHAVAITFDSNMTTAMVDELKSGKVKRFVNDAVIAELRDMHVPATFFLSGIWMEQYPAVARDIAADPLFEVGSHSYAHEAFTSHCFTLASLDLDRAADDLDRNETLLEGIADHPTKFFRFPGGCYDAASLSAIRPAGVQVIQYDLPSGDAFATDPAPVVAQTLANVRNGSIIVMHVTGGNTAPVTDRALPGIVNGLRARGFKLLRLTDLLRAGGAG